MLYLSIRVQEELVLQARPFPFHSAEITFSTNTWWLILKVIGTESDRQVLVLKVIATLEQKGSGL